MLQPTGPSHTAPCEPNPAAPHAAAHPAPHAEPLTLRITALTRRPWVSLVGWLLLLVQTYPKLWDKTGAGVFKLDAWVYYHAVAQWHQGGSLYDWYANPADHLWPFTYTPFAAWVFTPLTFLSDRSAQVLLTLATPACVALIFWVLARALGASLRISWAVAPWLALVSVAVLEPVYKNMEYGQINAILTLVVVTDVLLVPTTSPWRGALSALAACFKLTPAIVIVVFLARREWRAAATMILTSLAMTALCWVASPHESAQFFFSAMWDPSRAGFSDYSGNQNIKGALARALPESAWTPAWALASAAVVLVAWLLLRRLQRQLDRCAPGEYPTPQHQDYATYRADIAILQLGITLGLGLLISPISWSHHWVAALILLVGLASAGWHWSNVELAACAFAGVLVFLLAMQWWFPEQNHVEQTWPLWARVVGSSYTWWMLCAWTVIWRASRPRATNQHAVSRRLS